VGGGTVPGEVGPVITVVIGGTVETVDSTSGGGVVTVQRKTLCRWIQQLHTHGTV